MRFRPAAAFLSVLGLSLGLGACSAAPPESGDDGASAASSRGAPKLCAAVRGNGQLVLTHFASLSRIVDHYGVIDGMAGGSSASITTFTYESILSNPAITSCGGEACSADEKAARVALALKSVEGYAGVVEGSPEVAAVKGIAASIAELKAAYAEKGIDGLTPAQHAEAAVRLRQVLSIPEVRGIVNPELFAMLDDEEHLAFNVAELKATLGELGSFSVKDNRLFFRRSVLDWNALATLFGRIGDFYAGYGPSDAAGMTAWLDTCAPDAREKPWAEVAQIAMPDGGTCGAAFTELVTNFRSKVRAGAPYASRIDERVGAASSPLRKLVTTAVLDGPANAAYEQTLAAYVTGAHPSGNVPFAPSFDEVKFGYWGSDGDLAKVSAKTARASDLKSKKMTSLGNATWREILAASPAEPGLSPLVKLSDGRWSAGGWSDLTPTLALEHLGCERTVYVTREGDASPFAVAIAKNLGMSESEWKELYDFAEPTSSDAISLAKADGVWCTKWNDFDVSTMPAAVLDAFGAPLETRAGFTRTAALRPYSGATSRVDRVGCTAGLAGDATYPR